MVLEDRKFPKTLQGLTSKFRPEQGVIYKVSIDAYECKFHSRFADHRNENQHKFLRNWHSGSFSFLSNLHLVSENPIIFLFLFVFFR